VAHPSRRTILGVALTPPDPPLSDGSVVLRPIDERGAWRPDASRADTAIYSLLPSDA
jgi:hypothetical protein